MDALVYLDTDEGQTFLSEVKTGKGYFQPVLLQIFGKQNGPKNCGIQSSGLILGAQDIGQYRPDLAVNETMPCKFVDNKYHQDKMFDFPETLSILKPESLEDDDGMDLQKVFELLKAHRGSNRARVVHAGDVSVDDFRTDAKEALKRTNSASGIMVNFRMDVLGLDLPYGHHSPVVAYHEPSDRLLVLDIWPTVKEYWVKTEVLHRAMNTVDDASAKTRGYCIIT